MNVAIVSSNAYLGKVQDDLWVRDALKSLGANAYCAAWDDECEDWSRFDLVVLRSAWGYHHSLAAFEVWMDKIGQRLINPTAMIRSNIYKHIQFTQLCEAQLPVIPTSIISTLSVPHTQPPDSSLKVTLVRDFGSYEGVFVMKPVVSASGHNTLLVDFSEHLMRHNCVHGEAERLFQNMLNARQSVGVILQPFIPEIDRGEYALMFFGGQFSHAALRFPGVFRKEGTAHTIIPPPHVLALGERVMASLPAHSIPVYARVDIIDTNNGPLLMELELCEPHLFFGTIKDVDQRNAALRMLSEAILHRGA